ncbi:hypothetical protein CPT_Mangalyan_064 [Escherichia phage Mangalyan]|nr:hypothetical protein CPT_Mangalyan_064 [Escherichia phage Mangalyan]
MTPPTCHGNIIEASKRDRRYGNSVLI